MKTKNVKFNVVIESTKDSDEQCVQCLVKIEDESFASDFMFNVDIYYLNIYDSLNVFNENEDLDADTRADFDTEEFKSAFFDAFQKAYDEDIELKEFSFNANIELAD